MVRIMKAAAVVPLALIIPMVLQGCGLADMFQKLADALTVALAEPMCVLSIEMAYMNTTEAKENVVKCQHELHGTVKNATVCCFYQEFEKIVPTADDFCCNPVHAHKVLQNLSSFKDQNNTYLEGQMVELCHNITKNQTKAVYQGIMLACAPEATQEVPALTDEEAVRAFDTMVADKLAEQKTNFNKRGEEFSNTIGATSRSSLPASIAGMCLLAGAVTALLVYGGTAFAKRVCVRREKDLSYAQLLG